MSLFESDEYRWRETYFVFFQDQQRPSAAVVRKALEKLGDDYELVDLRTDEQGCFESLTLYSPRDFAAMDISYVQGEEVDEQVQELRQELRSAALSDEERAKLELLPRCTARYDIYHFEQVVDFGDDDEDILDPGGLLLVLERLADLCQGLAYDPQAGAFL
ncbi:MAG: hypothetical protein J5I93_04360 [Pirellulaceae bacterium]|nr:hypothetical protein [Pirellulaceae bacterium]